MRSVLVRDAFAIALAFVPGCTADGGGESDGTDGADASEAGSTTGAGTTGPGEGTGSADGTGSETSGGSGEPLTLPPPDGGLDYQLGGAYEPPPGVEIVSRDRSEMPAFGPYNVCYVNGYQAQESEADWWLAEHPELILRDESGDPVIDADWNEMLLDIRTDETRAALAEIVGGWITGCRESGFDAIEIDNLDTYARSDGLLNMDQAVAFMALLSAAAHREGLPIAQKNSTELVPRRLEMGTDFVVTEECSHYDECQDYVDGYGAAVLMVEYEAADFDEGCVAYPEFSIVLRDRDLVTPGDAAYVYDGC